MLLNDPVFFSDHTVCRTLNISLESPDERSQAIITAISSIFRMPLNDSPPIELSVEAQIRK